MSVGIGLRLRLLLVSLSILLVAPYFPCHAANKLAKVTIYQLAQKPKKFDGQLVRLEARLVHGWEMGDSFMSDPNPRELRDGDPAYMWLYCPAEHDKEFYDKISGRRNIYAWFTGYFHFVAEPRIVYGAFYPGHLQFEVTEVSIPEDQPRTLAEAIGDGNLEEVHDFLRRGANLNLRDEYQTFPLFEAINSGHTEIALELLKSGTNPKLKEHGQSTFLMTAAWLNNRELAKVLLTHGVAVNAADSNGNTALIYASQTCPDGEMVQMLLDAGADPNLRTDNGVTALMAAKRNPIVAQKLLKAGADPAAKTIYGHTVEDDACDRGERGYHDVCVLVREALAKKEVHK